MDYRLFETDIDNIADKGNEDTQIDNSIKLHYLKLIRHSEKI